MLEIAHIHIKKKPWNAYTCSSSYTYVKVESVHEIADNQWNSYPSP